MINLQWPELPIYRTNLHGSKEVRAIEVLLYQVECDKLDSYSFSAENFSLRQSLNVHVTQYAVMFLWCRPPKILPTLDLWDLVVQKHALLM